MKAKLLSVILFFLAQTALAQTTTEAETISGFNIWTAALAAIAMLGYVLAAVLFLGKSKFTVGERRLAFLLFCTSSILSIYTLFWTGYSIHAPFLPGIWQILVLMIGPTIFLYLKEIFEESVNTRESARHYLMPVVAVLLVVPYIVLGYPKESSLIRDAYIMATAPILLVTHLIWYSILLLKNTKNEWQVDGNIQIWTRLVVYGMTAYTAAFFSYFLLVRTSFFNPQWDYAISFVMALGTLTIAYMGFIQRRVFSSEPIAQFLPIKKYQSSTLTDSASASIKKHLEKLLNEDHVFKENELRLSDLADYLGISYHQLSQIINEQYGQNFYEFINGYRIEHVKKLLSDPKYSHATILQIAFEAGFNNKASFNRYFKKETGLTPSAYRLKVGVD